MNRIYPRDMVGYGRNPPDPRWPNGARVAIQFVINYEEGGENNILHGDAASEAFLSEIVGAAPWPAMRHANMESIYEYGSRAGFWRLWRMFTQRGIPVTVYAVALAIARVPEIVAAMKEANWEIASHGYKWIDYRDFAPEAERAHLQEAIRLHTEATGSRPLGIYTGRSSIHTIRLAAEEGGFVYCSDSYADDLPYWVEGPEEPFLIIPYTLDANDMRFATAQGFNSGDQFFSYLKDGFDYLYEEGAKGAPKMMSIGLHCRLVGRPNRAAALARFLDYVETKEKVWLPRRIDIARHWRLWHHPQHPPPQEPPREAPAVVIGREPKADRPAPAPSASPTPELTPPVAAAEPAPAPAVLAKADATASPPPAAVEPKPGEKTAEKLAEKPGEKTAEKPEASPPGKSPASPVAASVAAARNFFEALSGSASTKSPPPASTPAGPGPLAKPAEVGAKPLPPLTPALTRKSWLRPGRQAPPVPAAPEAASPPADAKAKPGPQTSKPAAEPTAPAKPDQPPKPPGS
jgi:putative urate catabolism protein